MLWNQNTRKSTHRPNQKVQVYRTMLSSSWRCRYVWLAFVFFFFFFFFHCSVVWSWSLRTNYERSCFSRSKANGCFAINERRNGWSLRSFPPVDRQRRRRRHALQTSSSDSSSLLWSFGNWWKRNNKSSNCQQQPQPPREVAPGEIRIRQAVPSDIRVATDLLTEAFFSNNTNFFTYPWEWGYTYLSLDSDFPQRPTEQHREPHDILLAEYIPSSSVVVSHHQHQHTTTANNNNNNNNNEPNKQSPPPLPLETKVEVVGMVQVDGRRRRISWEHPMTWSSSSTSSSSPLLSSNTSSIGPSDPVRPVYLCNLAVRESWRRRGVATLLIQAGEQLVRDEYQATHLCLKVQRNNPTVIALYQKLGYAIFQPPTSTERQDALKRTNNNSNRQAVDSIWWMGKQLVQEEENGNKETNDALFRPTETELVIIPDE